ncbi:hypothetical protein AHAS_Ahas19G0064100 [Arachis hypogaea]
MAPWDLLSCRRVQLAVMPHHRRRRQQERQERERGTNSQGRERRLRRAAIGAIVALVTAAADDGAVAEARVTVVLASLQERSTMELLRFCCPGSLREKLVDGGRLTERRTPLREGRRRCRASRWSLTTTAPLSGGGGGLLVLAVSSVGQLPR